jgi:hypothetical protein
MNSLTKLREQKVGTKYARNNDETTMAVPGSEKARTGVMPCRPFSCPSWARTRTLLIQSQACCQLHQGAVPNCSSRPRSAGGAIYPLPRLLLNPDRGTALRPVRPRCALSYGRHPNPAPPKMKTPRKFRGVSPSGSGSSVLFCTLPTFISALGMPRAPSLELSVLPSGGGQFPIAVRVTPRHWNSPSYHQGARRESWLLRT